MALSDQWVIVQELCSVVHRQEFRGRLLSTAIRVADEVFDIITHGADEVVGEGDVGFGIAILFGDGKGGWLVDHPLEGLGRESVRTVDRQFNGFANEFASNGS